MILLFTGYLSIYTLLNRNVRILQSTAQERWIIKISTQRPSNLLTNYGPKLYVSEELSVTELVYKESYLSHIKWLLSSASDLTLLSNTPNTNSRAVACRSLGIDQQMSPWESWGRGKEKKVGMLSRP